MMDADNDSEPDALEKEFQQREQAKHSDEEMSSGSEID